VDENCPDVRYSLPTSDPHQGVLVPSQDIPDMYESIAIILSLVFIVDENCPDVRYNLSSPYPHQNVLAIILFHINY